MVTAHNPQDQRYVGHKWQRRNASFPIQCYEPDFGTVGDFSTLAAADLAAGIESLIHQFYTRDLSPIMTTDECREVIAEAIDDLQRRVALGTLMTSESYYSSLR